MFSKRCKSLTWGEMASASEAGLWRLFFGPRQRSPFEDGRQQDPAELNRPLVYWRRSRLQTHEKGGLVVRQAMTQRVIPGMGSPGESSITAQRAQPC